MKKSNKIKKKKGFTLVELIVTIVVVGILAILIVPRVSNIVSSGKNKYYTTIEKEMVLLAKDYYTEEVKNLPSPSSSKELTVSDLLYGDYINEMFKDAKGMPCNNSFIIVSNVGNKKYSYEACLYCEDYETTSETCRERKTEAAESMGAVVKNHQVLEPITNEEINSIKDDLINRYSYINNTITREDIVLDLTKVNINTLGNYIFTYIIPKANIYKYEGVIKVRDLIPPTITGDVIYTIKGQPIDIWNYITVSDNFYSVDEITKGYTEIDQVNINVPGSYRVKITATDKGGNKKEKEVLVKVIERIVTFTPEERDWGNTDVTVTASLNNIAGLEIASWRCRKGILGQEGTTWGSAVAGTGTSADITLSENGINIIEVEVTYKDGTVFVQQSGQYKIDKESPNCGGVSGESTTWTKGNRLISVGCVDDLSGCNQTSYSRNYSTTIKTDTITIQDSVGNEKTCSVNVYIDKIKPTCGSITTVPSGASNTSWVSGQRQVNIGCNDSDSLCITSTYTKTYTSSQTTGEIVIKDNANNEETCEVPIYLDTDTPTKPTITGTTASNTNAFINTLTISGGSSTSGIKGYEYCEMTSNTTEGCAWHNYSSGIVYRTKGTKYVFARAVNKANVKGIITSAYIVKIVNPILTYSGGTGCTTKEGTYQSAWGTLCTPQVGTGYTFNGWYNGNTQVTSSTIATGHLTVTANFTAKKYTVNYYLGNGTSTEGSTKLGSSTCTFGTACTLTTFANLGGKFPYSSADNAATGHTNYNWSFAGWSTSQTGTNRTYSDGGTMNPSTYNTTLNIYAVGKKNFYFNSGIAPTSTKGSDIQYWNPYSTSTNYMTSITITAKTDITGWTFCGYKGGSNTASAATCDNPTFAASLSGKTATPTYDTWGTNRSVYWRNVTVAYNANEGSGTTSSTTAKQYYNSGYGSSGTNTGANVSTPSFTLASNGFTKTGYNFSKWADGSTSGTQYSAGATYTGFAPAVNNTTVTKTMYAIWSAKPIYIYYHPNGGTVGGDTYTTYNNWVSEDGSSYFKQIINSGDTDDLYNYTTFSITRSGYTPVSTEEWCTKNDGTGTCYNHNTQYTYATYKSASTEKSTNYELNLYVNWMVKPIYIYYHPNGGTVGGDTYTTYKGWVSKDGSSYFKQTINSGDTNDLYNYTTFSITRSGYTPVSTKEWCTKNDGTGTCYNHSTQYTYATYKSASTEKSTNYELDLYVNWKADSTCQCNFMTRFKGTTNCYYSNPPYYTQNGHPYYSATDVGWCANVENNPVKVICGSHGDHNYDSRSNSNGVKQYKCNCGAWQNTDCR